MDSVCSHLGEDAGGAPQITFADHRGVAMSTRVGISLQGASRYRVGVPPDGLHGIGNARPRRSRSTPGFAGVPPGRITRGRASAARATAGRSLKPGSRALSGPESCFWRGDSAFSIVRRPAAMGRGSEGAGGKARKTGLFEKMSVSSFSGVDRKTGLAIYTAIA